MVKNIAKKTLLLILTISLFVGIFVFHEWSAKPLFINNFFNRFALKMALNSPETLTSLHILESIGLNSHNGDLDDSSPSQTEKIFNLIDKEHEVLKSYNNNDLSLDEVMSKRVAEYLFEFAEELRPFRFHNYPVNQFMGIQNNFPTFMQSQHPIKSLEDALYYIQRLKKLPRKFSESLEGIKIRTKRNIIPPRFVIQKVIEEMTGFTSTLVEDNILYTSLEEKLNKLDLGKASKDKILSQAKETIYEEVYPAYVELTRYFIGLSSKADDRDGFWKLPQGKRAYQLALKFFTSTNYTADYLHNVGVQEVARIQQNILTILESEGLDISNGFARSIELLSVQERFYYPDTHEGREQILSDYQTIIEEIKTGLPKAFNVVPEAKVSVERIPPFKEKTSPGAYYSSPAFDGSRPGVFYANLYDIKATPKYSMRTLAYHEAIPGHHFQIAVAQELEDMPFFRKLAPFTAYVEGWALYAERLAWELGYQDNPYDNIGRLQAELFRAVRLVVDTGIHAKRWSRQKAIEYMSVNTGMAMSDVISEVERYIVIPGQACAYKVGMMKILELRTRAKNALGEKFNLAAFHDVILKNGAVPLDLLNEQVDNYIKKQK